MNPCDWGDRRHLELVEKVEGAFWRATNTPAAQAPHKWDAAHHKFVAVAMPYYGADIDTGASGSGFPERSSAAAAAAAAATTADGPGGAGGDGPGGPSPAAEADESPPPSSSSSSQSAAAMKRHRRKRRAGMVAAKVEINSRWNLNSLPYARGSLLKHVPEDITGITVPWMCVALR